MRYIAIIPARYASTRFPGKPLAIIGGKPMIQRVYEQARLVLENVYVATDDDRIRQCVENFGGQCIMTSPNHPCGTNRCWEAVSKLQVENNKWQDTVVINIQGDEPFIQPEQIRTLMDCFDKEETRIATLVRPYSKEDTLESLLNPNTPKVVINEKGHALMFSRSVIPYLRGIAQEEWLATAEAAGHPYYRHIGMYAYRADVLEQIVRMPQSALEKTESLEQLRWLEAGIAIQVGITTTQSIGIDTPEDLERANCYIKQTQA